MTDVVAAGRWQRGLLVFPLAFFASACSINRFAVNKLGDALSGSSTTFASDDDLEFVGQAVPFSLKLIESLLDQTPKHEGLLLAAASGFTQYSYAWVQPLADSLEELDAARSAQLRDRVRRLDLRARDYGLRGLDARHPGLSARLRADPKSAVAATDVRDVPLLYWTAAAWGSAISVSKDMPDLVADQLVVEALIDRALALDEHFEGGAIHTFLISYEFARQGAKGDPASRAKAHYERALALAGGHDAGPYVAYAEAVTVAAQDWKEFEGALGKALAIDPDAVRAKRLSNLVMQRRARWLLSRTRDLFLDKPPH